MNTANKSTLKEIIQTRLERYFIENSLTPSYKKKQDVINDIHKSHKSNGRSLTLNQVITNVLKKHFSNDNDSNRDSDTSDDDSSIVSSGSSSISDITDPTYRVPEKSESKTIPLFCKDGPFNELIQMFWPSPPEKHNNTNQPTSDSPPKKQISMSDTFKIDMFKNQPITEKKDGTQQKDNPTDNTYGRMNVYHNTSTEDKFAYDVNGVLQFLNMIKGQSENIRGSNTQPDRKHKFQIRQTIAPIG